MKKLRDFRILPVCLSLVMVFALFFGAPAQPVSGFTWVVTKVADTNDGVCSLTDCSLREAIAAAAGSGDTIVFADAIEGGTIHLGSEIVINKSVTIDNSNHAVIFVLNSDWDHRTFTVNAGKWLTLKKLVFSSGQENAPNVGGFILNNGGTVTIYDCAFDNGGASKGGAIYNESGGTVNIYNSRFYSVQAPYSSGGYGGAIYNKGTVNLTESLFENCFADTFGGAIYNEGTLSADSTAFKSTGSLKSGGGAIYNAEGATATIINSTFTENTSVSHGAAIRGSDASNLYVTNSTFSGNDANGNVGGIYTGGNLTMANTILANTADGGKDCYASGATKSFYNNLIENNSAGSGACGTPVSTSDPLLGALEYLPGYIRYLPIPSNSPAVDAGDDATCVATDARGVPRPFGAHCDIGAYEYAPNPVITSLSPGFVMAGSPGFFLFVNGTGFHTSSVVQWNGADLDTVFVSTTQIKGKVDAPDVAETSEIAVTVETAGATNPVSDPAPFYVHSFADVLPTHVLWRYVEGFYKKGITTGCAVNPLRYCPDRSVTRAEMAVFILRAWHANDASPYTPADDPEDPFVDVPAAGKDWMEPWIEAFYKEGFTTGCGGITPGVDLRYCPERNVTRAEMAVFLIRAKSGPSINPVPDPSWVDAFIDVPVPGKEWMKPFIEYFAYMGYTTGCGGTYGIDLKYCPERLVNRAEMATFIDRVFNFPQKP